MGAAPCSQHHLWLLVPLGWFLVGSYPCSADAHVVPISVPLDLACMLCTSLLHPQEWE